MREVRIRPRAQVDLESIFAYIAIEMGQSKAAQRVIDGLFEAFELLAQLPEIGACFEDDDLERAYRRKLVGNRWVYYTFDESELVVWRVFHVRQDIGDYGLIDF